MLTLLYVVHVLICFFLIAVVLLQQGSGADLSVFGGGATQTAFGARGATNVLHKATVGSFVAFMITTLAIGAMQVNNQSSGVLGGLPEEAVEAEAPAADEVEAEAEGAIAAEPAADAATTDAEATDAGAGDAADAGTTDAGAVETPSDDAAATGDG
ncbi:MAG: preprotein translocase subunit SecG [Acidobacteriota bacterium]